MSWDNSNFNIFGSFWVDYKDNFGFMPISSFWQFWVAISSSNIFGFIPFEIEFKIFGVGLFQIYIVFSSSLLEFELRLMILMMKLS